MKGKEPHATGQSDQPAESGQQMPVSRNGVFLKRGKGQSFDEFKKVCIQRLIDVGLIKGKLRPKKAGTGSPSNGQNLPEREDQQ